MIKMCVKRREVGPLTDFWGCVSNTLFLKRNLAIATKSPVQNLPQKKI